MRVPKAERERERGGEKERFLIGRPREEKKQAHGDFFPGRLKVKPFWSRADADSGDGGGICTHGSEARGTAEGNRRTKVRTIITGVGVRWEG